MAIGLLSGAVGAIAGAWAGAAFVLWQVSAPAPSVTHALAHPADLPVAHAPSPEVKKTVDTTLSRLARIEAIESKNAMTWPLFRIKVPDKPTIFRVVVQLSDIYNSEYGEAGSHYSFMLSDFHGTGQANAYAFVKSPAGAKLFEATKDGIPHAATLAIQHFSNGRTDIVRLMDVIDVDAPWATDPP